MSIDRNINNEAKEDAMEAASKVFLEVHCKAHTLASKFCEITEEDVGIGLSVIDDEHPGYIEDMQAYLCSDVKDSNKAFNIVHDIMGRKRNEPHFLPRLIGYKERA